MKLAFFVTIWPLAIFFACLSPASDATISEPFAQFLRNSFGAEEEKKIARRDLGTDGSFGGGKQRTKANKRPVIFVHGLTGLASDVNGIRRLFREKGGYKDGELYATTNGGGLKTVLRDSMKCDHVKKIRLLIRAVTQFTHSSQVDIIGYSMGSPTARKAGYEASARIFTIRSTDDGTVGTVDCDGRSVSGMDGQNDEIVLHNYSHQMVMFGTGEQQLKLLSS
uniref:Lipase n=1 Tax=Globodera pallida TaxID=36090 RepID=A0A183BXE6_GLOPA